MPAQLTFQPPQAADNECAPCLRLAWHITRLAAAVVALVRPLAQHRLTADECEQQGLPEGTSNAAVYCTTVGQSSPWRLDLWTEADDGDGQACLHLKLLGCEGEVWYQAKQR